MNNKIKITFDEPVYNVLPENGVVVCTCKYEYFVPKNIDNMLYYLSDSKIYDLNKDTITCVARLRGKDIFNAEKGKKIAFTKVQNAAYKKLMNKLTTVINNSNKLNDICKENWSLNCHYITKNEKFLFNQ